MAVSMWASAFAIHRALNSFMRVSSILNGGVPPYAESTEAFYRFIRTESGEGAELQIQ